MEETNLPKFKGFGTDSIHAGQDYVICLFNCIKKNKKKK